MKKNLTLIFIIIFFSSFLFAQPVNDDIAGALPISIELIQTGQDFTNATDSGTPLVGGTYNGATPCYPTWAQTPADLWFKFTSNAVGGSIKLNITNIVGADGTYRFCLSLYNSDGTTELDCTNGSFPTLDYLAPATPTDYLVRVQGLLAAQIATSVDINASGEALKIIAPNNDPLDALEIGSDITLTGQDMAHAIESSVPLVSGTYGSGVDCYPSWANTPVDLWYYIMTDSDGGVISVDLTNIDGPNGDETGWHFCIALYNEAGDTELDCTKAAAMPFVFEDPSFSNRHESASRSLTKYLVRVQGLARVPTFDITASGSALLPIELGSFKGMEKESSNYISWTTLSEINSDYIDVQSSADRAKWEVIGSVSAQGKSFGTNSYSIVDENPYPITYYRLNAFDLDGSMQLSDVISVTRDVLRDRMVLSPNPTSHDISLSTVSSHEENGIINLISLDGTLLISKNIVLNEGTNVINLDLSDISKGVYMLSLNTSSGSQIRKIMIQ